jgi:hypothetical protein
MNSRRLSRFVLRMKSEIGLVFFCGGIFCNVYLYL